MLFQLFLIKIITIGNVAFYALAPGLAQTSASVAPIGLRSVALVVVSVVAVVVPLAESPPQAVGPSGSSGRSIAGAVVIVIETCAPVASAGAPVVVAATVDPSGELASSPTAGPRRRRWLLLKMFFQHKDGRKTPLSEADSQQQFRCRDDFGCR